MVTHSSAGPRGGFSGNVQMAFTVGVLQVEMVIAESHSLKDKRSVLKSMLEGMRGRFNVSAAEVAHNDLWQRAGIAIAVVSNSQAFCDQVLSKCLNWIEANPRVSVTGVEMEFL